MSTGDAMFKLRDVVKTWWASGDPMGHGWVYGVVEAAGPRTFTVRWESGIRNRRPQDTRAIEHEKDAEIIAETRKKWEADRARK